MAHETAMGRRRVGGSLAPALCLLLLSSVGLSSSGCSVRGLAVKALSRSLAASGDVFASDEDPQLVREAMPFALKTLETLLAERPEDVDLLQAACRAFTSYSYAFVETDAFLLRDTDYSASLAEGERALQLYLRARDYCLEGLERLAPGITGRLQRSPEGALEAIAKERVDLLYWTGAAWGAAMAAGKNRPDLVVDLPAVKALVERVLALDEAYQRGAAHELMLVLEAQHEALGGSRERARDHFRRAVDLAGGTRAAPFVALAESVAVPEQDAAEFRRLLEQALAVDPDGEPSYRLQNLVAQKRARRLLERIPELFFEVGGAAEAQ